MKHFIIVLFLFVQFSCLFSQIVTIDPAFFTIDSTITVTYDATMGSGGLTGETQVYAHTGVITESGGAGNWQNVQGEWGTDDPKVKMENIGDNKHQLTFNIKEFYGLNSNSNVTSLAFVFRNIDGSKEGKTANGGDIFIDLPEAGAFDVFFQAPTEGQLVIEKDESVFIKVVSSETATITLYDNDIIIDQGTGKELTVDYQPVTSGDHVIRFEAVFENETKVDEFSFVFDPQIKLENVPTGIELGLNRISESEAILSLYAPGKKHVLLLSNLNDYKASQAFSMNFDSSSDLWWINLENLESGKDYTYQYLVDGKLKIADPLSELILDPSNDQEVVNFGTLPQYPVGMTEGRVSYFQINEDHFNWTDQNFKPAEKQDLVIYEILLRDFLASHSYIDLIDTLAYLKRLGINAIELMPIQEFEANDSWGYNPSYHMALDKYYGSPEDLKALVDAAHANGIAVILDVVFNHAFGQSPLVQLYWDTANNRPSADSPYFNPIPRHPFNVGFDFNHESEATRNYVKRSLKYWIEEYHIDGYRFDLSKGFTQKFSSNNEEMSAYDASRVAILLDYAQIAWSINPDHFVILEHFASDIEEFELSAYGMMVWANGNYNINEATMGYHEDGKSDFSYLSYIDRGWVDPYVVGYMESHDEERLMYKNLQFGNSSGSYNVKDLNTALNRNELAAVFFFCIPGPKMIWQFGELGYDFSINRCVDGSVNENCRLSRKPIRWDYRNQEDRQALLDIYEKMINLKVNEELFETQNYSVGVQGPVKTIQLKSLESNAIAIGNFDVTDISTTINIQHGGKWFDFFTGDSIMVDGNFHDFDLSAGEYRLYFDTRANIITGIPQLADMGVNIEIFPNPVSETLFIKIDSDVKLNLSTQILDLSGRVVTEVKDLEIKESRELRQVNISSLYAGLYYVRLQSDQGVAILPFNVVR